MTYILTDVRKRWWTWSFFAERRRVRTRWLQLNVRLRDYGRPLDEDEMREYLQLRRSLTVADSIYYRSLGDDLIRFIPRHIDYTCDGCARQLGGGRLMCLDCPPSSAPDFTDTIDFCDFICAQTTVSIAERNYLEEGQPHTPEHDLIKIRTVLSWRDIPRLRRHSQEAMSVARLRFEVHPAPENLVLNIPSEEPPRATTGSEVSSEIVYCAVCRSVLDQPCWYCVECADTFLCDACESASLLACRLCTGPFTQPGWYYGQGPHDDFMCNRCQAQGKRPLADESEEGRHVYSHPLVRCTKRTPYSKDAPPLSTAARLGTLETKVGDVDAKLDRLQDQLDVRLLKMEEILKSVQRVMNAMMSRFANEHGSQASFNQQAPQ